MATAPRRARDRVAAPGHVVVRRVVPVRRGGAVMDGAGVGRRAGRARVRRARPGRPGRVGAALAPSDEGGWLSGGGGADDARRAVTSRRRWPYRACAMRTHARGAPTCSCGAPSRNLNPRTYPNSSGCSTPDAQEPPARWPGALSLCALTDPPTFAAGVPGSHERPQEVAHGAAGDGRARVLAVVTGQLVKGGRGATPDLAPAWLAAVRPHSSSPPSAPSMARNG